MIDSRLATSYKSRLSVLVLQYRNVSIVNSGILASIVN